MSEPFPKLVRYALMGPFGVFAAAYVLALLGTSMANVVLTLLAALPILLVLLVVLLFSGAFGTFHI